MRGLLLSILYAEACSRQLSIMSWNILAPHFASPTKYPWIQPTDLEWRTRQELIVDRICELDADVVCLQEVEVALWPKLLARLAKYDGELQEMKRNHPVANAILVRRGTVRVERVESRSRALLAVLRDDTLGADVQSTPLYVANVHLEAGGAADKVAQRLQQVSLRWIAHYL